MKITHETTKTLINEVNELLKAQGRKARNYKEEKAKIEIDKTYSQGYQQELIHKLREDYLNSIQQTKEKALEKLNKMLEFEIEQENILELDVPEFANTLNLIKASRGELNPKVIKSIVLNFAGQYQILKSFNDLFAEYFDENNSDEKPFLQKYVDVTYFLSAEVLLSDVQKAVENIEVSEVSTCMSLRNIFKALIHFGETRGLTFTDSEKDSTDIINEAEDVDLARQVMGLK